MKKSIILWSFTFLLLTLSSSISNAYDPALMENDPAMMYDDQTSTENDPIIIYDDPALMENDPAMMYDNPALIETEEERKEKLNKIRMKLKYGNHFNVVEKRKKLYKTKRELFVKKFKSAFNKILKDKLNTISEQNLERLILLIDKEIEKNEYSKKLSSSKINLNVSKFVAIKEIILEKLNYDPALMEDDPAMIENDPAAIEDDPALMEDDPAMIENDPAATEDDPAMAY